MYHAPGETCGFQRTKEFLSKHPLILCIVVHVKNKDHFDGARRFERTSGKGMIVMRAMKEPLSKQSADQLGDIISACHGLYVRQIHAFDRRSPYENLQVAARMNLLNYRINVSPLPDLRTSHGQRSESFRLTSHSQCP